MESKNFLTANLSTIITIAVIVGGWIVTFGINNYRLNSVEKKVDDINSHGTRYSRETLTQQAALITANATKINVVEKASDEKIEAVQGDTKILVSKIESLTTELKVLIARIDASKGIDYARPHAGQ